MIGGQGDGGGEGGGRGSSLIEEWVRASESKDSRSQRQD